MILTSLGWRGSLRHRLAYGTAVGLTAIASVNLVLFLYERVDSEYYGAFVQDIREFTGFSPIIFAGGFLAGAVTWYPPSRHEPPIDTLRLVGSMIGLAFWIPGLLMPIAVWLAHPRGSAGGIDGYVTMALFGCVAGGILGATLFGPAAYLAGVLVLGPIRYLERSMFPTAVVVTASGGRLQGIANATVAAFALLAAGIAFLSALYDVGRLAIAAAMQLSALF